MIYCICLDRVYTCLWQHSHFLHFDHDLRRKAAITTQPSNKTVCRTEYTKFSLTALGYGLTCQWQVMPSGSLTWQYSAADGCKTAALTIEALGFHNGNKYRCVVTDKYGNSVTSNIVMLTVITRAGRGTFYKPYYIINNQHLTQ